MVWSDHVISSQYGGYYAAIGLNVFVVKGVAPDVPLETIFRGVWPFLIAIIVCILILIIFPQIATVLPDMLM